MKLRCDGVAYRYSENALLYANGYPPNRVVTHTVIAQRIERDGVVTYNAFCSGASIGTAAHRCTTLSDACQRAMTNAEGTQVNLTTMRAIP